MGALPKWFFGYVDNFFFENKSAKNMVTMIDAKILVFKDSSSWTILLLINEWRRKNIFDLRTKMK